MNWLLEQPLAVVILGVVLGLGLGVGWTSTGRKEWLFGLAAVIVLTIAGLIIEQAIVTDREAVEATLIELARDVQSNNHQAVLRHIAADATEVQREAAAELPNYRFDECRITKVHGIDVDASLEPRSAVVEFNVVANGSFREGGFELSGQQVYRWVQLHLVREPDGQWRIQRYQHRDPQEFLYDRDSRDGER